MDAAAVGVTEKEEREQRVDQQDIFHRMVFFLAALTHALRGAVKVFLRFHSNSNFAFIRGSGLSIDTDLAKVENSEHQGGSNDEPLKLR